MCRLFALAAKLIGTLSLPFDASRHSCRKHLRVPRRPAKQRDPMIVSHKFPKIRPAYHHVRHLPAAAPHVNLYKAYTSARTSIYSPGKSHAVKVNSQVILGPKGTRHLNTRILHLVLEPKKREIAEFAICVFGIWDQEHGNY